MVKYKLRGRLLTSFQDLAHEGGDTRSQGGIKDNDSKIKIQDHWCANNESKKFPRTRLQVSRKVERFMNYLEEQTDGEAIINSIKNGDQPLPRVTQVSIAGTSSNEQPPLKDKSMWSDQEKKIQKIDR
nr:hypothetical protein [Tanacetum cinerariifolium]